MSRSLVILGATASGKTSIAVAVARELNGEIISADSRQVYRGLDIGSGKDLEEYGDVPYHLIDIVNVDDEYNVFRFQQDCRDTVELIQSRGALPIICGGTGLYLEAAITGYAMPEVPRNESLREELAQLNDAEIAKKLAQLRPDLHNTTDLTDRERTMRAIEIAVYENEHETPKADPLDANIIGIRWPRDVLRKRIRERLEARMDAGLVEEVQGLIDSGVSVDRLRELGLEYRYVADFIDGRIRNRNDFIQKLSVAIAQFAKRQETWFRRMERRGTDIHWIDNPSAEKAIALAREWF